MGLSLCVCSNCRIKSIFKFVFDICCGYDKVGLNFRNRSQKLIVYKRLATNRSQWDQSVPQPQDTVFQCNKFTMNDWDGDVQLREGSLLLNEYI